MTRKAQVFIIEADEANIKRMKTLIMKHLNSKVISKFNHIGEITSPYFGNLEPIDGLIDDLFLLGPENPENLKQELRLKRCAEVQKLFLSINTKTNSDLAYSLVNHVAHCGNCQDFAHKTINAGGNKDVENYIAQKLKGEVTTT